MSFPPPASLFQPSSCSYSPVPRCAVSCRLWPSFPSALRRSLSRLWPFFTSRALFTLPAACGSFLQIRWVMGPSRRLISTDRWLENVTEGQPRGLRVVCAPLINWRLMQADVDVRQGEERELPCGAPARCNAALRANENVIFIGTGEAGVQEFHNKQVFLVYNRAGAALCVRPVTSPQAWDRRTGAPAHLTDSRVLCIEDRILRSCTSLDMLFVVALVHSVLLLFLYLVVIHN
ncbi:hypothetical protein C8R44DRAFT_896108 [Mycena epipterygia]|nr:hypothetical protein C8R44DRAFT_896108 [Mycena epipterygia]